MKAPKEVTMREIAEKAGVAVSTVSKALRNDPSISKSQCKKIRLLAQKMGYRPNPLVSTLMAQIHHQRRQSDPHQIAWLDFWGNDPEGYATFNIGPSLVGARERSLERGYSIEVYRPIIDHISLDHLGRILSTRGHWAVIIPPVPDRFRRLNFDINLQNLAAVTIGTSLKKPITHRVSPNHFQAGLLAVRQMRAKGFQRVGIVLSESMHLRVQGTWLGAFYAAHATLPQKEQTAPLLLRKKDPRLMIAWAKRENLDAVLLTDSNLADVWLGYVHDNPQTIGWLMRPEKRPECAGIDYQSKQLGRLAVDSVVSQIHRNERGSPPSPYTMVTESLWVEPPKK